MTFGLEKAREAAHILENFACGAMKRPLRLYFVGDEEGGEAFLAYTASDAKRFAWNCAGVNFSGEWIDVSVKWIKDARMEHVAGKPEGHRLTVQEGLKTGAFGPSDNEGPECLRCGAVDCDNCAYRDIWTEAGQE